MHPPFLVGVPIRSPRPFWVVLHFKSFLPQKAAIHNGRKDLPGFAKYFAGHY